MHILDKERYLAGCRLETFMEDGKQQTVGECQSKPTSGVSWNYVLYDTSGQVMWPRATRTQAWKSAVRMLSSPDTFTDTEGRASHLHGDFYEFGIRLDELQGG